MITFDFGPYALRLLTPDDAQTFFNLIEANRSRLEDYFSGTVSRTRTLADTGQYTSEVMDRIAAQTYYPYFIIHQATGDAIGWVDVKNIDWNIPKAELGCFIDQHYAGKVIAHQAMHELIQHLFHERGFNKLFLRTAPTNTDACALAEKCGFEIEGLLRSDYKTSRGELVDLRYYGLLNTNAS